MSRVHIFVSYAHEDHIWRDRLRRHLGALENNGLATIFDDREIRMGEKWEGRIEHEFNEANVIVLLLSPYFGSSKFCMQHELPQALERHSKERIHIVPIVCVEHDVAALGVMHIQLAPLDDLGQLKFLYEYGEYYDKPLALIAQNLRELIERNQIVVQKAYDDYVDTGPLQSDMENILLPHGFFSCKHQYALGELVSIDLGAQQGSTRSLISLDAEIYCFEERLKIGQFSYRIRVRRIRLRLGTSGCGIRLGKALGERDGNSNDGKSFVVRRCTPIMWEISAIDDNVLDGRVLGDEKLIDLQVPPPESAAVEARITVFPEDFEIDRIDRMVNSEISERSKLKLKLAKLVLRKCSEREGDEVVLGRCRMINETEITGKNYA